MRFAPLSAVMAPFLILGSGMASAHAFLDRANPRVGSTVAAAPSEVALAFTQALEPAFSTIEVTNLQGRRVDQGTPSISGNVMRVSLQPIAPGTYRVKWHVLSVDTHATEGGFTFEVRP